MVSGRGQIGTTRSSWPTGTHSAVAAGLVAGCPGSAVAVVAAALDCRDR